MKLQVGKVIKVHPAGPQVDVMLISTGRVLHRVQVLADGMVSTNTGMSGMPTPTQPADSEQPAPTGDRDIYCVVGDVSGLPIVLGYLHTQVGQMMFDRADFEVRRHPSDVYSATDADGNIELSHPSGTFVRIAESPSHEDLTRKDRDQLWNIRRNTGRAPHLHIEVAAGGGVHTVIDVAPSGDVSITNDGDLAAESGGSVTIKAGGSAEVEAGADATIKAPTLTVDAETVTFTGAVTVAGALASETSISLPGPGGALADVRDTYNTHTHGGVSSGAESSGVPDQQL